MKTFKDKVVVITGAGSGIGRELAKALSNEGAQLALSDINEEGLKETAALCKDKAVFTHVFDVSNKTAYQEFAQKVLQHYKQVDVVFNNAGVALGKAKITDISYEEFEWLMNINFWGVVYGIKEFLPSLMEQKEAAIINISSLFGLAGIAEQTPYCSSKFAVRGLSEALRMELIGTPVKVFTVHPGGIKTNIANNARITEKDDAKKAKDVLDKFNQNALRHTADKAAKIIIDGVKSGEEKIMIGAETYMADTLIKLFPAKYSQVFKMLMDKTMQ